MPPAPVRDRLDRPPEPAGRRLPLDHPVAFPRPSPVVREPQQVETARLGSPAATRTGTRTRNGGPKRHQPGLLRVERQAILAETFRQYVEHPPSVRFASETDHDVVRVADEEGTAPQQRFHLTLEPDI